jgi:hypothetical protein
MGVPFDQLAGAGIDWAKLSLAKDPETIEIRQVQEFADFPDDIQKIMAEHPDVPLKGRSSVDRRRF